MNLLSKSVRRSLHCALTGAGLMATMTAPTVWAGGVTLSPMIGYYSFDSDQNLDDDVFGSIALGYQFDSPWATELSYLATTADYESQPWELDVEQIKLDWLYHFNHTGNFQPYFVFGGGYEGVDRGDVDWESSVVNGGLGLKWWLSEHFSLRTDVRAINNLDEELTSYAAGLGLSVLFGSAASRTEEKVTEPVDTDSDGVADSADNCPDTEAGVVVDLYGCEMVVDGDGDGVPDEMDECPDTRAGARVDALGCYVVITETKQIQMMVQFGNNSAEISPQSYSEIEQVAQFMQEYPLTQVVIEGHTDDSGPAEYNLKLSQERANSVAEALTSRFGIDGSRVSAIGYGEARPIVPNDSPENRARNRRVTAEISAQVDRIQE